MLDVAVCSGHFAGTDHHRLRGDLALRALFQNNFCHGNGGLADRDQQNTAKGGEVILEICNAERTVVRVYGFRQDFAQIDSLQRFAIDIAKERAPCGAAMLLSRAR